MNHYVNEKVSSKQAPCLTKVQQITGDASPQNVCHSRKSSPHLRSLGRSTGGILDEQRLIWIVPQEGPVLGGCHAFDGVLGRSKLDRHGRAVV